MKKILKLTAMVFGAVAMVFGLNSCSKDDDKDCCTWDKSETGDEGTYTFTGKACEDGYFTFTYTYTDKDDVVETYSDTGDWMEDTDYTWDYIKEETCS